MKRIIKALRSIPYYFYEYWWSDIQESDFYFCDKNGNILIPEDCFAYNPVRHFFMRCQYDLKHWDECDSENSIFEGKNYNLDEINKICRKYGVETSYAVQVNVDGKWIQHYDESAKLDKCNIKKIKKNKKREKKNKLIKDKLRKMHLKNILIAQKLNEKKDFWQKKMWKSKSKKIEKIYYSSFGVDPDLENCAPMYNPTTDMFQMDFEGRTIYGNAVNVAESMCSKEIIYRYKYDEKKQNAMSFEEVIQRIIYFNRSKNIDLFSIEGFESDYSKQEQNLIEAFKKNLIKMKVETGKEAKIMEYIEAVKNLRSDDLESYQCCEEHQEIVYLPSDMIRNMLKIEQNFSFIIASENSNLYATATIELNDTLNYLRDFKTYLNTRVHKSGMIEKFIALYELLEVQFQELAAHHKAINKDNYRGDGNND